MSKQLIKQMREQRMRWVDLEPGKRVRIIRPTEHDIVAHLIKGRDIAAGYEEVKRFVVDWDGFTSAHLLGAAVGASDPLPFDADLWAEVLADNMVWVQSLAQAIVNTVVEHRQALESEAKN